MNLEKLPLKQLRCYHKGDIIGEIYFAIFDDCGPHIPGPACVFSAGENNTMSTVLGGESLINSLCRHEGMGWMDVRFCDLSTHHSLENPKWGGYYQFEALSLKKGDSGPGSCFIDAWRHIECPPNVYASFKHLIGEFPTVPQLTDRRQACYKEYSDKDYEEEVAACGRHVNWINSFRSEHRQEYLARCIPLQQAFAEGYRYMPWGIRRESLEKPAGPDHVAVDFSDSHLLGQFSDLVEPTVLDGPAPYAIFGKELDWYPLRKR